MPLRQQLNREKAGFRAGHDTSLPDLSAIARRAKAEAKSLRRDDGSGQAVIRDVDTSKDVITLATVISGYVLSKPGCMSRDRHCERSEAKQSISPRKGRMDCFVASLLAMTA